MVYCYMCSYRTKDITVVFQKKIYDCLQGMAIVNGQAHTASMVRLPSPAGLHSINGFECSSFTVDTNNSSHMDENLPQYTSESLCDTARDFSCQNGLSSDQVTGKSRTIDLKAHCAKEIESSNTSAEENEVIHLPESNVLDPQHARYSLMQTKDEYLAEKFIFRYQYLLIEFFIEGMQKLFDDVIGTDFGSYLAANVTAAKKIQWLIVSFKLTTAQQDCVATMDTNPLSSNFDITLLSCLLRNVCGLCHFNNAVWKNPAPGNPSREADVTRLRECRKHDTIVTSTDKYLAENDERTDSLSLAGTHRIDNSFVMFFSDFLSKVWKLQYRKTCMYSKSQSEVTESVENDNIDYDEEAFDTVGVSLKINNAGEIYPCRDKLNDKNAGRAHWLSSVETEDFYDPEHLYNQEMIPAVFSTAITPTNEMRFNRSKIVEVKVIEQSRSNVENCQGSKYKLDIDDDKQLRAVVDEGSSTTKLGSLVTDYFKDNQQQQNNTTVAAEGNSNLIETNVKEAESLNERLCNRKKTNPSDKQEGFDDAINHNGNMAEIRAMSLVSDLTDLPFPRIDTSYLRALVYRIEEPLLAVIDRLASDNPPTPHISMRYELLRFCTLRTYPRGDKPYLIRLAAAGFYYASDGDGVVCYCCGSRRYNWTGREDPMKVHQGIKPNCNFLIKNEDVNVPVVYDGPWSKSLTAIEAIPEPKVITQEVENVNREYAPERQRNQESVNEQQTLGINNATPKHSQYTIKSQRLGSYKGWPKTSKLKPEDLADAGFFHAGFGDCVRCFFCGIGLRHWSDDDDPWIEHARWARTCVFVRQKKGEEFVNLVQLAVQLTQDNGQAGATVEGSGNNNSVPVSTIEKLLLSKAALSAAELGFHTEKIKRAVEEMIRNGDTDNISPDDLLCKVLEIEERDEIAAASTAGTAISRDTNKGNGSENKTSISSSAESPKKDTAYDSLQDLVAIKHENEVLKEQTLCKVCLDNTVCIVFLPCGHLVTCADCAPAMRKCPICRALVRGTVRTYMS